MCPLAVTDLNGLKGTWEPLFRNTAYNFPEQDPQLGFPGSPVSSNNYGSVQQLHCRTNMVLANIWKQGVQKEVS